MGNTLICQFLHINDLITVIFTLTVQRLKKHWKKSLLNVYYNYAYGVSGSR